MAQHSDAAALALGRRLDEFYYLVATSYEVVARWRRIHL